MPSILSVNVGAARPTDHSAPGVTGIDKRPVDGPVELFAPGPRGSGASGVAGDTVCDLRHHGGDDQAVYAYAAEDLAEWSRSLDRQLTPGMFGENLTTQGLDLAAAVVGEIWRIGPQVVLQVSDPRIPCRTFAGWLQEKSWVRRFTQEARSGTYLRVLQAGAVSAGMEIVVDSRPAHGLTVGTAFRAMTLQPELLPLLVEAEGLSAKNRAGAARRG